MIHGKIVTAVSHGFHFGLATSTKVAIGRSAKSVMKIVRSVSPAVKVAVSSTFGFKSALVIESNFHPSKRLSQVRLITGVT
jgi:hypothetical protein